MKKILKKMGETVFGKVTNALLDDYFEVVASDSGAIKGIKLKPKGINFLLPVIVSKFDDLESLKLIDNDLSRFEANATSGVSLRGRINLVEITKTQDSYIFKVQFSEAPSIDHKDLLNKVALSFSLLVSRYVGFSKTTDKARFYLKDTFVEVEIAQSELTFGKALETGDIATADFFQDHIMLRAGEVLEGKAILKEVTSLVMKSFSPDDSN